MVIVGGAILLGALQFRWRNALLGAGAALATAATIITATRLGAPYGPPTRLQIGALIVAVLLEVVALSWVMRRFSPRGERALTIAVLSVVGAHFVVMAPAFGPLVVLLGLLTVANALAGVYFRTYSLRTLWAVDGFLKMSLGAAMFDGQFLPCFPCAPA